MGEVAHPRLLTGLFHELSGPAPPDVSVDTAWRLAAGLRVHPHDPRRRHHRHAGDRGWTADSGPAPGAGRLFWHRSAGAGAVWPLARRTVSGRPRYFGDLWQASA